MKFIGRNAKKIIKGVKENRPLDKIKCKESKASNELNANNEEHQQIAQHKIQNALHTFKAYNATRKSSEFYALYMNYDD